MKKESCVKLVIYKVSLHTLQVTQDSACHNPRIIHSQTQTSECLSSNHIRSFLVVRSGAVLIPVSQGTGPSAISQTNGVPTTTELTLGD